MIHALLLSALLADAGGYTVEADVRGQPEAVGLGASFKMGRFGLGVDASRALGLPLADKAGWAYGATGTITQPVGPVLLGLRAGAGTAFDATLFGQFSLGPTAWTVDVGYRHTSDAVSPDARTELVLGNSLNATVKVAAPLGALTAYATGRFSNGIGGYSWTRAGAAPAEGSAGVSGDPGVLAQCDPNATGQSSAPIELAGSDGTEPVSGSGAAARGFAPGLGLSIPAFNWATLYAEGEYVLGQGPRFFAGVTFSFEGGGAKAKPAAPEAEIAPEPMAIPPSNVEFQLTSNGKPISGVVTASSGARTIRLPVRSSTVSTLDLDPGRWRLRFQAPGHLGREIVLNISDPALLKVAQELTPVPARRSVMLTSEGIKLFRPLEFSAGSVELTEESKATLAEVADLAVNEPTKMVTVTAHVERDEENDAESLSQAQADAIIEFLGTLVAPERLSGVGAGARHPLIPNLLNVARKLNRRVTFELN